jgi:hypothetical protein
MLSRLLREPLVHFIVAGAVLYGTYAALAGSDETTDSGETIIVDRRALLTFMQYRANAFEPETFSAVLDTMSDADLQELIDAYINEEVLYREAESIGLDSNDYIIRQRLVQKMSFLMSDIADRGATASDDELTDWFEANIEAYAIQPWTTFTHVFFDVERRGAAQAAVDAQAALAALNESGLGFNDAPGHGDRFPFLRNYVERTYEYVASHFGYDFAEQLASLDASSAQWQGPLQSSLGAHVVLITTQAPRAYPDLEAVRADVERDFNAERTRMALGEMTESVRDQYRIEIREVRADSQ